MKDGKDILSAGDVKTMESASLYAEAKLAEVLAEHKKRKIKLIKLGGMLIIVSVIMIFATRSWFTMSREVEGTGANMNAEEIPFDVATKGTGIRNSNVMSVVDGKYVLNTKNDKYAEGSTVSLENASEVTETYYTNDSVLLRYTTGTQKVGPNGCNELSFFVVPKTNETTPVKITLNVVAFAKLEKFDGNGDPIDDDNDDKTDTVITEITNATEFAAAASAVNNSVVAGKAADYVKASDYLKGHIMFFGEKAASNADYLYTEAYPNRVIEKTIPANNKGKAVAIPINWMWTNTLGQIVLKQSDSKRDGKPVVQDLENDQLTLTTTQKAKVIKYVKDNKDDVLANWTTILTAEELLQTVQSESNPDPKTISEVVDGLIDNMDVADNFNRLSSCYNSADYAIGTKISYFLIEVTVQSGE